MSAPVLLTGGTGLVGRATVDALMAAGHAVVVAGRTPPPHGIAFVACDLSEGLEPLAGVGPLSAVVHLADARTQAAPVHAARAFAIDAGAAVGLAELAVAAGARSVVYASSGIAREAGADLPLDLAFHAAKKRAAEIGLAPFQALLPVTVLRLHFPFSAAARCFVRELALGVRRGDPVRLNGPTGPRLNPVAVEDVADAIVASLTTAGGTYEIAGPDAVTLRTLADELGRRLGREPAYVQDADVRADDLLGDDAGLHALLQRPPTPLGEALDRLVAQLPDDA